MTIPGLAEAPTKNAKLLAWVEEIAALTKPDRVVWADGSQEEWDRLTAELVEAGTFIQLNEEKRPNSFLARSNPKDVARVEDRTYICCRARAGRRPDQQLDGPGRDAQDAPSALRRLDARPHDVRRSVQHGTAGRHDLAARRRDHRLRLRRRQHADHDAHGQGGPGPDRRRAATSFRPSTPSARRWPRASRTSPGPAATPSTSSTSPRPARSGRTAPATAATPCSARSASRCASRRSWRATRAGSPSTC